MRFDGLSADCYTKRCGVATPEVCHGQGGGNKGKVNKYAIMQLWNCAIAQCSIFTIPQSLNPLRSLRFPAHLRSRKGTRTTRTPPRRQRSPDTDRSAPSAKSLRPPRSPSGSRKSEPVGERWKASCWPLLKLSPETTGACPRSIRLAFALRRSSCSFLTRSPLPSRHGGFLTTPICPMPSLTLGGKGRSVSEAMGKHRSLTFPRAEGAEYAETAQRGQRHDGGTRTTRTPRRQRSPDTDRFAPSAKGLRPLRSPFPFPGKRAGWRAHGKLLAVVEVVSRNHGRRRILPLWN